VYRRRRQAVLLASLSVLVLPVLLISTAGSAPTTIPAAGAPASAPLRTVYVVQPGDTLWSIARKLDSGADPRETVDHLVELNGGAALQPGQRLRLS
jgi:nucleoid-associated protein YgaU